jgi:hypothetical protein
LQFFKVWSTGVQGVQYRISRFRDGMSRVKLSLQFSKVVEYRSSKGGVQDFKVWNTGGIVVELCVLAV